MLFPLPLLTSIISKLTHISIKHRYGLEHELVTEKKNNRKQQPNAVIVPRRNTSNRLPTYHEIDSNIPTDNESALIRLQAQARMNDERRRNLKIFDELDCTSASFRRGLQVIKSGNKRLPFAVMDSGRRFIHQIKHQQGVSTRRRPSTSHHPTRRRIHVRLRPEPERKPSVRWLCSDIKGAKQKKKKKKKGRKKIKIKRRSVNFLQSGIKYE
jgi:hypothetical protein